MTKSKTPGGRTPSIDFKAKRVEHTAPKIVESFVDDDGEMQHILESGNTISEANYKKHWVIEKTPLLPKYHKGDNILKPQSK